MTINLDKKDLVSLVKGTDPDYNVMDNMSVKPYGRYNGSYGTWTWEDSLHSLSEEKLYSIYVICKNNLK